MTTSAAGELERAIQQGNIAEAQHLLLSGADANEKCKSEMTSLIWAAQRGMLEIVRLLIAQGARVNDRNFTGDTALYRAASSGHEKVVDLLIAHHALIDGVNDQGTTALMAAVSNGRVDAVRVLLEKGADPLLKDNIKRDALSLARQRKNETIISMLEEAVVDYRLKKSHEAAANGHVTVQQKQQAIKAIAPKLKLKKGPSPG